VVTASCWAAWTLHGLTPGPLLFKGPRDVVYSVFVALFGVQHHDAAAGVFRHAPVRRVLQVPKNILLSCVYDPVRHRRLRSVNNRTFDVVTIFFFGCWALCSPR
jgi:putative tricarboxylic transport membrane protein